MAYKIHTSEKTLAKVYRDAANNEWYVVAAGETKAHPSTYYTNDKADAIATAELFTIVKDAPLPPLTPPKASPAPKTMQQILNVVIKSGFYQDTSSASFGSPERRNVSYFMCDAVGIANDRGVITSEEAELAYKAIRAYIFDSFGLDNILRDNGLPYEFNDRLAIYKDWENRPKLKDYSTE